jgi:hypothetical protein
LLNKPQIDKYKNVYIYIYGPFVAGHVKDGAFTAQAGPVLN